VLNEKVILYTELIVYTSVMELGQKPT